MTYNVFGGTLNHAQLNSTQSYRDLSTYLLQYNTIKQQSIFLKYQTELFYLNEYEVPSTQSLFKMCLSIASPVFCCKLLDLVSPASPFTASFSASSSSSSNSGPLQKCITLSTANTCTATDTPVYWAYVWDYLGETVSGFY